MKANIKVRVARAVNEGKISKQKVKVLSDEDDSESECKGECSGKYRSLVS